MPKHFQNRVRELREAAGLSQTELGRLCEPRQTGKQISRVERGEIELTQTWMYRLAKALHAHPFEILEKLPHYSPEEQELITALRERDPAMREAFYRILGLTAPEKPQ